MSQCPDCAVIFTRPQALGSHRRYAHGKEGESPKAQYYRRRTAGLKRQIFGPLRPGRIFGMLTVVGPKLPIGAQRPSSIVRCECSRTKVVQNSKLREGDTISCGCYRDSKKVDSGWRQIHKSLRISAFNRGINVELNAAHIKILGKMPCFYCGKEPSNYKANTHYSGVDRVRNNEGYTTGNVLPCCKFCNQSKRAYSLEHFIEQLQRYGSSLTLEEVERGCKKIAEKVGGA